MTSAGSSSPQGITTGDMPTEAQISCAPLSAVRILMPLSASTASAFTLRWRYWLGHGTT